MTADTLTRRRADNPHRETWNIYFGDVHVGTIGERAGTPKDQDQWSWRCGLVGGGGRSKGGDGRNFEACREAFQLAWEEIGPTLTEALFETWREHRDATAWKYRMHDLGLPIPTQSTTGRSRCFCGAEIAIASIEGHVRAAHRGIGA